MVGCSSCVPFCSSTDVSWVELDGDPKVGVPGTPPCSQDDLPGGS